MPNSGCVIICAIFLPPICTSTVLGLFSVAKGTCFWIQSDFDSEILTDCAHKALLSLNAHPLIATLSLANQTGQACVLQTNGHNYKGIQSQKHQSRNTKRLVMYWARVTLKPNTKTEGKKYFSNARIMIHIRGFSEKRTRCLEKSNIRLKLCTSLPVPPWPLHPLRTQNPAESTSLHVMVSDF